MKANRKSRSNRAASPAISTVIVTAAMVALITIALSFASNFLLLKMAESEFNSAKQFMQTLGLQIDDVAWVIGRTETIRYSSRYADVAFNLALNYTVYVNTTTESNLKFYSNKTGIICFNMPVSRYSAGTSYYELIYPSENNGFLLNGASAPTARIFGIEKLPMVDGSFARVVVMPTIRMLNLSLGDTNYVRLYLPILSEGEALRRSDSITLTGESVSKTSETVTGIRIEVSFPLDGFDNFFFKFPAVEESIVLDSDSILELYTGGIDVALGVHA
ncbi:MAG: hypothetical protein JSV05_01150 [Candidatus Bathyarchaeota archaeon]|nr:MAG: hypothetical protein JSV05_01150 [Candidatus Bathyarchaeota archaeon]